MPATGERKDPVGNFNFVVEIESVEYGVFRECSGLDSTVEATEHAEGGDLNAVRKLPGRNKYSNIVLKWGVTDDPALYQWHLTALQGNVERRNGSIVVRSRAGEEVARWNFSGAWPTKWDGPEFNASSDEVAVEGLELAHEGLVREV